MPATIFYISPAGDDRWTGKLHEANPGHTDGPFATLQAARDGIRSLKKAEGELKDAVTVQLRGGTYRMTETFQLRPEDSGTEAAPITWEAYPGEKPVLTGGVVVTGRGNLPGWDLESPGAGRSAVDCKPRQLFYKGQRQRRSRWPKYDPKNPIAGGWIIPEGPVEELEYIALRFRPEVSAQVAETLAGRS